MNAAVEYKLRIKTASVCAKCNQVVPKFETLDASTELTLLTLINSNSYCLAISMLRQATACSESEAKIWVFHRGVPSESISPQVEAS